jgi:hypothetical protein
MPSNHAVHSMPRTLATASALVAIGLAVLSAPRVIAQQLVSTQPRASVTSPCRPWLVAPFFRRASRGWDRNTATHPTGCNEHQTLAQGGIAVQPKRFYPDDPIWRDGDMRSIPPVAEFDLSKS